MAYFDFAQWLNLNRDQADRLAQESAAKLQSDAAGIRADLGMAGLTGNYGDVATRAADLASQANSMGTTEGRTQLLSGLSPGGNAATLGLDQILLNSGMTGGKYGDMAKEYGGALNWVVGQQQRAQEEQARRDATNKKLDASRQAEAEWAKKAGYAGDQSETLKKMGYSSYDAIRGKALSDASTRWTEGPSSIDKGWWKQYAAPYATKRNY